MSLTDFLHGVDFIKDPTAPIPVDYARSSVIGLVGTAPMHIVLPENRSLNEVILVNSDRRGAILFGTKQPGFTIPAALDSIYKQRVGLVLVVNVWDLLEATHRTDVTDESVTFVDSTTGIRQAVANSASGIYEVTVTDSGATTTYVEDTDYEVDYENGEIVRILDGAIGATEEILVDYTYPDTSGVTTDQIIGEVTVEGIRTGMQAWIDGFAKYSFDPRVLIAPGYSTTAQVSSAMQALADRMRAHFLVDAPIGTTLDEAISGRNGIGPATNFAISSTRGILCYPHVYSSSNDLEPFSQYLAGVIARTHAVHGFWWSPSNKGINGITGTEVNLSSSHVDPNTDVQLLNSVGIVTVFGATGESVFGASYRTWGNRSAAYPTVTDPINFIPVQVVEDQLQISLQRALLQFIDRPINKTTIDFVVQTIRYFLAKTVQLGALIDGNAWFEPDDNLVTDISAGRVVVRMDHAAPPPLERLTIRHQYNVGYLSALGARTLERASTGVATELLNAG